MIGQQQCPEYVITASPLKANQSRALTPAMSDLAGTVASRTSYAKKAPLRILALHYRAVKWVLIDNLGRPPTNRSKCSTLIAPTQIICPILYCWELTI
jgi:hypothetical protein